MFRYCCTLILILAIASTVEAGHRQKIIIKTVGPQSSLAVRFVAVPTTSVETVRFIRVPTIRVLILR